MGKAELSMKTAAAAMQCREPETTTIDERGPALIGAVFAAAIAAVLLFSFFAPRFIAVAPVLLGLIGYFSFAPVFGDRPVLQKPVLWWAAGILALAGMSVLWAYDPSLSMTRTIKMIPVAISAVLLTAVAASLPVATYYRKLWLFPAVIGLCLVLVIFEILSGLAIYRVLRGLGPEVGVSDAVMNRPLVLCTLFLCPAFLILYCLPFSVLIRRGAMAVLLMLAVIAVTVAESESAALVVGLGIATALLFPYRWKPAWAMLALIFIIGIFGAPWGVQWAFTNLAETINQMPFLGYGDGYGAHRLEIYDFVARHVLQSPFWGYGIESSRALQFDSSGLYYGMGNILHPHNFALQLWVEFGIIGAFGGAGLALFLLWKIYKLGPGQYQRCAMALFITFFAVASISYNIWHGWWLGLEIFLLTVMIMIRQLAPSENLQ